MPKIYLSPSTQEYNPYVTGAGSEEYFMNLLADAMEPILLLNGIQFSRNTPDMTAASSIRQANAVLGGWRLHKAALYVTLEPCPMCAGAIVMAGIDAVFFGAYDPRCGCAGSLYDLPEDASFGRVIPCSGGLLEAECRLALNAFFDLRRC